MQAAIFHEVNQDLTIEEVSLDKLLPREVLVRTAATAVSHTDIHYLMGRFPAPCPAILGHESAGIVEAIGERVTYVQPGDHVIACIAAFCGHCHRCLKGQPQLCINPEVRRSQDEPAKYTWRGSPLHEINNVAGYAEKMILHENAVVKIPDSFPFDEAALLSASVSSGLGAVFNSAKIEPGSTVAVFGTGTVGLSIIQGARIAGASKIIAVDWLEEKLAVARNFGATQVVVGDNSSSRKVRDMTEGGVDYAFDAVGIDGDLTTAAWNSITRGGTAVVVGMIPSGVDVQLSGIQFLGEKKIQGSLMGSGSFRLSIPKYIEYAMEGKLNLQELIGERAQLPQINTLVKDFELKYGFRSVIMFD